MFFPVIALVSHHVVEHVVGLLATALGQFRRELVFGLEVRESAEVGFHLLRLISKVTKTII